MAKRSQKLVSLQSFETFYGAISMIICTAVPENPWPTHFMQVENSHNDTKTDMINVIYLFIVATRSLAVRIYVISVT